MEELLELVSDKTFGALILIVLIWSIVIFIKITIKAKSNSGNTKYQETGLSTLFKK